MDAFVLERGGFPDDDGLWAGCGDTPQEFVEEFFHYDDYLGFDDNFG